MSVPFGERGGFIRGCLDLACGRFPRFVFGGSIGYLLPVFHFHDEARADLDAKLGYIAENGYRTVTADEIAAYVRGTLTLPERSVGLCFDDAWASVCTTAAPLLKEYGLRAIVYAIPGRIVDSDGCREVASGFGLLASGSRLRASGLEPGARSPEPINSPAATSPFMTWPELRALDSEGTIDAQSHTLTHAMVFTGRTVTGFVRPGYEQTPLLSRPVIDAGSEAGTTASGITPPRFLAPCELGAPLYAQRSRMSDGRRVKHSPEAHEACVRLVASEGGQAFFQSSNWRSRLDAVVRQRDGTACPEGEDEQRCAIEDELDRSRSELRRRLDKQGVNHVCLPWGVSGRRTADALRRLGFITAVANRMRGVYAMRPGDDPHWLKRLPSRYVYRLPGRGRRWWFMPTA